MKVVAIEIPPVEAVKGYTITVTEAEAQCLRFADTFFGQVQDSSHARSVAGRDALKKLDRALEAAGVDYTFAVPK